MALSGWLGRIIRHVLKDRGHMVHCFMWHKFWLMLVSKQAFPYHESFVEVLTNTKPTHGILLNFLNNSCWTYLSRMVHHWAHGQPPNRQTNFPMELVYSWIFFTFNLWIVFISKELLLRISFTIRAIKQIQQRE